MISTELRLVSKILDEGDLRPILDAKITLESFHTPGAKLIFRRIMNYYHGRATNGEVPTRAFIEKEFPKEPLAPKDRVSLKALVEEFMTDYVRGELSAIANYIYDNEDKPDAVLKTMGERYMELAKRRRISEDHILSNSVESIRARYESYKNRTGYVGIPYPWEVLNEETGGILNSEFVVLYGRPKSMKTWVLLSCACHAYDFASRKVLICTREMRPDQIMDRCVCILIGAPYTAWKKGLLHTIQTPEGCTMQDRFDDLMSNMQTDEETCRLETGHGKSLIITSDRADPDGGGVTGLRQKVEDFKPELLCVDAMYLMKDDRENRRSVKWYNQSAISQDMKDLALDKNIPIIGTNQAKRESEEKAGKAVSNIAFSDSYGMDCDLAIEIIKKSTRDKEVNELALSITAAREINMTGFAIHGNAATTFGSLMMKRRDPTGQVMLDKAGNPALTPVVFDDYQGLRDFFKDSQDPEQAAPKAVNAVMAEQAFKAASKAAKPTSTRKVRMKGRPH